MATIDVMSTVTQIEINKACKTRSLSQLEDVLFRVKVEYRLLDEQAKEIYAQGQKLGYSERYKFNIVKLNLERLEAWKIELGKRRYLAEVKRAEEKEKQELYKAVAIARMPMLRQIQEPIETVQRSTEIVSADPEVDNVLNDIARKRKAGMTFDEIAEQARQVKETGHGLITEYEGNLSIIDSFDQFIENDCTQCGSKLLNESPPLCKSCIYSNNLPKPVID